MLTTEELLAMPLNARITVDIEHDQTHAPTVEFLKVDVEKDCWYPTGFDTRVEMFGSEELARYGAHLIHP